MPAQGAGQPESRRHTIHPSGISAANRVNLQYAHVQSDCPSDTLDNYYRGGDVTSAEKPAALRLALIEGRGMKRGKITSAAGMRMAVCAALMLGTGACSTGKGSSSTEQAPTATKTVTVTAAPTPTQSTEGGVFKLGETSKAYKWGNVTALDVDQRVPVSDAKLPGAKTWMGILVKTCVTAKVGKKPTTLGWGAWTVADKDGGQYDAFAWTGTEYPQPVYPMDRAVPVGQCVKGWIVFNKPAGIRPVSATYGPSGADPVVWEFSN